MQGMFTLFITFPIAETHNSEYICDSRVTGASNKGPVVRKNKLANGTGEEEDRGEEEHEEELINEERNMLEGSTGAGEECGIKLNRQQTEEDKKLNDTATTALKEDCEDNPFPGIPLHRSTDTLEPLLRNKILRVSRYAYLCM